MSFYKMDPALWNNRTANLSLEEEAAYLRIVNAMHITCGPIVYNERVLAGLFRCSIRKARALLDALVKAGKVTIEGGQIVNERAISDLVHRGFVSISRAESGAKGGRTRAENAAKALADNEPSQAIASSREEKRREDSSVSTNVDTGAAAPQVPDPPDPAKQVFDAGVSMLKASGQTEQRARSIVGKWRKQSSDGSIIAAIGRAHREGAQEPISFIEGCLKRDRVRGLPTGSAFGRCVEVE